jgi:hypothetical protein
MKIFVSYASEQHRLAERITIALRNARNFVYFFPSRSTSGGEYDNTIRSAIAKSDVVIFLISPDSVETGNYALTELKFAEEKWPSPHSHVLPVIIQSTPEHLIPEYLRVSWLKPKGDIAAEVLAEISKWQTARFYRRIKIGFSIGMPIFIAALFIIFMYFTRIQPWKIQPAIIKEIASGNATGHCSIDPQGSGIKQFEKGWMLSRNGSGAILDKSDNSILYALIRNDDSTLKWEKKADDFVRNTRGGLSDPKCLNDQQNPPVILGFSKWYCDPSSHLQAKLGESKTVENRGAVQFQEWSDGLVIYGIPTKESEYDSKTDTWDRQITEMSAMFLENENMEKSGTGKWRKITSMGFVPSETRCSPLWHWIGTHRYGGIDEGLEVLKKLHANHTCPTLKTLAEYTRPRESCRLH